MKFHLVEREVQQLEVWQVWNLKREVQESVCRQLAFFRRISDDILIYLVGKSNFEILDLWDGQNSAVDVQGNYRKQKTTLAFQDLLKFVILWWFSRYVTPTNLFRKRCEPVLVEEEGLQVAGEQDWLLNCVWICWKALKRGEMCVVANPQICSDWWWDLSKLISGGREAILLAERSSKRREWNKTHTLDWFGLGVK